MPYLDILLSDRGSKVYSHILIHLAVYTILALILSIVSNIEEIVSVG